MSLSFYRALILRYEDKRILLSLYRALRITLLEQGQLEQGQLEQGQLELHYVSRHSES